MLHQPPPLPAPKPPSSLNSCSRNCLSCAPHTPPTLPSASSLCPLVTNFPAPSAFVDAAPAAQPPPNLASGPSFIGAMGQVHIGAFRLPHPSLTMTFPLAHHMAVSFWGQARLPDLPAPLCPGIHQTPPPLPAPFFCTPAPGVLWGPAAASSPAPSSPRAASVWLHVSAQAHTGTLSSL